MIALSQIIFKDKEELKKIHTNLFAYHIDYFYEGPNILPNVLFHVIKYN